MQLSLSSVCELIAACQWYTREGNTTAADEQHRAATWPTALLTINIHTGPEQQPERRYRTATCMHCMHSQPNSQAFAALGKHTSNKTEDLSLHLLHCSLETGCTIPPLLLSSLKAHIGLERATGHDPHSRALLDTDAQATCRLHNQAYPSTASEAAPSSGSRLTMLRSKSPSLWTHH